MKKVLVTGSEGFIGSHLVEELVLQGFEVRAMVLYNSFNSIGNLKYLEKETLQKIDIQFGDITDQNSVNTLLQEVDIVFHLAAIISIPYSYKSPNSYAHTNILGTLNVLNACKLFPVEKILVTSTSEVYGTAQYVPIDEKHPKQGQSPYSASKIGADALAESYYRSFGLPVSIVRPFNTFGPRQSSRAIIPTIINQLHLGNTSIMLGSLEPTRDFVFVKDTAKGFIKIAESDTTIGQECNIATGEEISIGKLAETLIKLINPKAKIEQDPQRARPKKSEVFRLCGDGKKLEELTAWKPQTTFDDGLSQTIEWFKANPEVFKELISTYNV